MAAPGRRRQPGQFLKALFLALVHRHVAIITKETAVAVRLVATAGSGASFVDAQPVGQTNLLVAAVDDPACVCNGQRIAIE